MSDSVSMSGRLPSGEDNGLEAAYRELLQAGGPERPLVAVVLIDQDKWSVKKSTKEPSAVARIVRLEVLTRGAAATAVRLLQERYVERTGNVRLDLSDWDDDGGVVEAQLLELEAANDEAEEEGE